MYCLPLHWHLPNPARNLTGARLDWISEKWLDSGFAGAGAKIWHKPTYLSEEIQLKW